MPSNNGLRPTLTYDYSASKKLKLDAQLCACARVSSSPEPAQCFIEGDIHAWVAEVVTPEDTVLEVDRFGCLVSSGALVFCPQVGGRYATTACAVAKAQANSGRVVSVEPDPDVWHIHQVAKN